MKVLYDYQIFHLQKYGGISRYFIELISQYHNNDIYDIKASLPILFSDNEYLLQSSLSNKFMRFYNKEYKIPHKINKLLYKYSLQFKRHDLLHFTYYDSSFLEFIEDTPYVITIYDMIHEKFGKQFNLSSSLVEHKRLLAESATKIIAISQSTKEDIVQYLNISPDKIDVVYLASSLNSQLTQVNMNLPEKYLLFVGNREKYKNFITFINSIIPLLKADKNFSVVCAGGNSFTENEISLFYSAGIQNQIYQLNVSDNQLVYLYSNAEAFIFPSLYEGFGIPILEAFSFNCPVVCSNTSSLIEVADSAATYFSPYDQDSILEAVWKVITDKKLKNKMINEGQKRLKDFSWEQTAMNTKNVYMSVI